MIDTFELSKIAGAVLCALLVIVGTDTAIDLGHEESGAVEGGYKLPEPAAAKDGEPAGKDGDAAKGFDVAAVLAALPTAKPDNGAAIFKKCAACHAIEKGGPNKVGPDLWGVVGRQIASKEGFTYSEALKSKQGDWTLESLAAFVHGPKTFAPGTAMSFPGIPEAQNLADLLAYLNTQGDSPAPLPAPK